jgi:hypothetical protein
MGLLSDLVSGFFGNESADKAADAQVNSAKLANQTILDMFNRGNQIQAPNQQAGWNALAMQGSLLGNPNMVPQGAVANALAATGQPGAQSTWGAYGAANPDVVNYYRNNPGALQQFGGNMDRALEYHYNTYGQGEGRQLPTATYGGSGVSGGNTGIGVGTSVDDAYNTFLDSGFGRSALETTNNDYTQMVGAFGAGGTSLSGSAIGALNDRNRRNTAGAFGNYYNALSGISGTGAQIGQNQASAANAAGTSIANNQKAIGDTRSSSYLTQGQNNANMVNSGINAAAMWFGG